MAALPERAGSTSKRSAVGLVCTRAALPCGKVIPVTPRRPGFYQFCRPLGEACEGCKRRVKSWYGTEFEAQYMREVVTGELVGPICRPYAFEEETK